MAKILTKDLKGRALDYMTAKALGLQAWVDSGRNCEDKLVGYPMHRSQGLPSDKLVGYPMHRSQGLPSNISSAFSTSWAQMGPYIETLGINLREDLLVGRSEGGSDVCTRQGWIALLDYMPQLARWRHEAKALRPLTAACRCLVLSYAGEEVEVPDELL